MRLKGKGGGEEGSAPRWLTPGSPSSFWLCSYQRFASCYHRFYRLQPELTRSIYDQFVAQLQASIKVKRGRGIPGWTQAPSPRWKTPLLGGKYALK